MSNDLCWNKAKDMLIYSYAIYLTLHNYNFFKIKQLREDKNKMENQEVLILEKIKNRKENPTQKIDKNKRKGGK